MAMKRVCDPDFLNGSMKLRSFIDSLANSPSNVFLLWFTLFVDLGRKILALVVPFQFTLVGFFPLTPASFRFKLSVFFKLKLNAEFSVTVLDPSHVLIYLTNDLDYNRIFCHRSYFVNNCFMKLSKWSPSLDIGVELPHLSSPRILHALSSMFGQPLNVDNSTYVGSKPSLVLVLVELDITKNYTDKIWLGPENLGYIQMVHMEEFPSFCVSCKCLGHLGSSAPMHVSNINSNGIYIFVLVSSVNDGLIDGGIKNAFGGVNDFGVVVARAEVRQDSDRNACVVVKNLDNVPFVMLISPINVVVDNFGGVIEVNCNQVGNVVDDLCVIKEGVKDGLIPNPYLVNLVLLRLLLIMLKMMMMLWWNVGREADDPLVSSAFSLSVENVKVGIGSDALPINDEVILDGEVGTTVPLVDVPISLIANDALVAQLAANKNDYEMDEGDWLDDCYSTPNWDAKEDFDVHRGHSKGIYDLNVISIAEVLVGSLVAPPPAGRLSPSCGLDVACFFCLLLGFFGFVVLVEIR
ncbi:hypothetical protein M5K25_004550 [Dendrobium thyrsiflorum]|uniref:DUF4283 domain-containing protein n=1 Tax=Dendrobium thyrsiflorum TaxID=117978 RepID=A0ABD0VTX5_DENTH